MTITKLSFGDLVVNEWASESNPIRKGIFVREKAATYELTDGKGRFWQTMIKDSRLRKTGTIFKHDH